MAAASSAGTFNIDFDPSSIVNFAQLAVMSAQMNLPDAPDEYYTWASSFKWASLNFGVIVPKDKYNTGRRLEENSGFSAGFDKYCDALGIEQQYLFIDILGGYIVLAAASIWIIILYWVLLLCLKPCIGEEKVMRMWNKIDVLKLFVSASYYGFYPFMMGIFFQLSFHMSLEEEDKKLHVARILSCVAVFCLLFEIVWFSSIAVVAMKHKALPPTQNPPIVFQRIGIFHNFVQGKIHSLTKYWKSGFHLWWVFKLIKWAMSALIVTSIFAPKPAQPALILFVSVGYTAMILYYRPYADAFQNKMRLAYAFLGVANACIFTVYGMGNAIDRFGEEAVSNIGKGQLILNVFMFLLLLLCNIAHSLRLRTCPDFRKCVTCRCKHIGKIDENEVEMLASDSCNNAEKVAEKKFVQISNI